MTENTSHRVTLGIGSNMADGRRRVAEALDFLGSMLEDLECSTIYTTAAASGHGADYTNAVARGVSQLGYDELNLRLKRYETETGRTDEARRRGEVAVDIDIVMMDDEIVRPRDTAQDYFKIGFSQL